MWRICNSFLELEGCWSKPPSDFLFCLPLTLTSVRPTLQLQIHRKPRFSDLDIMVYFSHREGLWIMDCYWHRCTLAAPQCWAGWHLCHSLGLFSMALSLWSQPQTSSLNLKQESGAVGCWATLIGSPPFIVEINPFKRYP